MSGKKNNYIWVSLVVFIIGTFAVYEISKRIQGDEVVLHDRLNRDPENQPLSYLMLNGEKRKVPEFALINQDSLLITDQDYLGKVYVVEFFFTSCPSICPLMNRNLVELQDAFEDEPDFGIASFTIDPEHDTPAVLKEYAERYGIVDMDWHLMTGEVETIFDLANSGFNIYAEAMPEVPGGFEHSGLFALIDKQGYIRSRKDEFGNPLVYYRGSIPWEAGINANGETEQISLLKEDIKKLLEE
jgi:protein SCO1/2